MHLLALLAAAVFNTAPVEVLIHRDLVYGEDPVLQSLDVYQPRGTAGPLPFLVFIHNNN